MSTHIQSPLASVLGACSCSPYVGLAEERRDEFDFHAKIADRLEPARYFRKTEQTSKSDVSNASGVQMP